MKNKKAIIAIIACLLIIVCGGTAYQSLKHERNQDEIISALQGEIGSLRAELNEIKNAAKFEWSDTAFNYFAIGNSITKHGLTNYWWNEIGMAASTEEKDYVHLINSYLESTKGETCFFAYNYSIWEGQAADRAETFETIDSYLDDRLNLVTIQLSENVSDVSSYEQDYEELIEHIKLKAPNAQIIVIDDFWSGGETSTLKQKAANNTGVQFVSLAEIKGNTDYQCGMNTVVYDADGKEHTVEHSGVALHPGDKGMEYIANAVIPYIE